ncbi:maleylacetoacetate isomerase [Craterilacuibacter sp.]|uniref:maleylacetoacetate isomerase n=1 Tax=Craterilacuibacter sp. TaxID=2870909 RepID=UPI003F359A84
MKLYGYWRSSAAYRVRIALALKGIEYTPLAIDLSRHEQADAGFTRLNPQQLVPLLQDGDNRISQSLAIIEYLDETRPDTPLLPPDAAGRARVHSLALIIACDIHPLNNLRVLEYLQGELGIGKDFKTQWIQHWIGLGLAALESRLAGEPHDGPFCHGDSPGLADCCLVPQLYNARRFGLDLAPYPTLVAIDAACAALPAFIAAHPQQQRDAK